MLSQNILLAIALAPLLGAVVAGLFGRRIGEIISRGFQFKKLLADAQRADWRAVNKAHVGA